MGSPTFLGNLKRVAAKKGWEPRIDSIINTINRMVENIAKKIIQDDVVHEDSEDIANMLNYYFLYIRRNIAESNGGNNGNHLDYMTHINQPNSFFFRPIHCYSTEKWICSLKNKSSYLNTIPVKILKLMCDIINPCLTNIINRSITTGVFPDNLKKARVTPIPKEGDKCNLSNYWAISVSTVFGNLLEKAYTQQYDYFEKTRTCINNNMSFALRNLQLCPFYISFNTV